MMFGQWLNSHRIFERLAKALIRLRLCAGCQWSEPLLVAHTTLLETSCHGSCIRERSGSVIECLTPDRGAAGLSLTGVTRLWSLSRHIYPSLVLVQPRKTCPYITERLLMGCKESNQTAHVFCQPLSSLQ